MNAFENIVAEFLESRGFWVRRSVKVPISIEDKKALDRVTMPTPEVDLVAYSGLKHTLVLVEVKSFLDSTGIWYNCIFGTEKEWKAKHPSAYRIFWDSQYRRLISKRLRQSLKRGLLDSHVHVTYALVAGKTWDTEEEDKIRQEFRRRKWLFFGPSELYKWLEKLPERKTYEDDVVTMTAKLILRNTKATGN